MHFSSASDFLEGFEGKNYNGAPLQTDEEKDMSGQMLAALEAAVLAHTFPKSNVDVYCLVLESGGSDLAVCVSAASLALADAGVEMSDLVSACRVVSIQCCPATSGLFATAHVVA